MADFEAAVMLNKYPRLKQRNGKHGIKVRIQHYVIMGKFLTARARQVEVLIL